MVTEIHCSKLARPMVCAGSLFFKDLLQDQPNEAAKEGTAAGEYLERLLTNQDMPTHAKNGVRFTEDMKFHIDPIAKMIHEESTSAIHCETPIDWQTQSGIWIKGKFDASYTNTGDLCIDDLKFGWGIVEVKNNWQLLGYAIGETLRRKGYTPKHIRMRIIQPRPHHEDGPIREWRITFEELLVYKEQIERRMVDIARGFNHLVTGNHCKYCPAAADACPAFNKAIYRGVEVVHEFIQDSITDDEMGFQLDLISRIKDLVKIKEDSLKALAVDRLKRGKIIPNYICQDRIGDRQWKTGITPEAVQMMTGKDIIEKSMMSPAKAEKLGIDKALIKTMVTRPLIGQEVKRVDTTALGNKIFSAGAPA